MKFFIVILVACISILSSVAYSQNLTKNQQQPSAVQEKIISACCETDYNEVQIAQIEKAALDGNVDSSIAAYLYRLERFGAQKTDFSQLKQYILWLEVAVNNGDDKANLILSGILTGEDAKTYPYAVTLQSCKHGYQLIDDLNKKGWKLNKRITPECKSFGLDKF